MGIFDLVGNSWNQVGNDIVGEAANDHFGRCVAINSDGYRIAIGADHNDGNGDDSGHVRVFDLGLAGTSWNQVGNDIDGEAARDLSGRVVAMNSDGSRIVIGAYGNENYSGHVRVLKQ